ncbi:unnamed protein product [Discula destructiva]
MYYIWPLYLIMSNQILTGTLNVLRQPLALHSLKPPTGFHRDGFCRTSSLDRGHHAVAGVVTDEFLDFSAAQGNNLRVIPGMREGCKWCLCTGRWLEVLRAFEEGRVGRAAVPRVVLAATEESVLGRVPGGLEGLRAWAADDGGRGTGGAGGGRAGANGVNGVNGLGMNGVNGAGGDGAGSQ